MRLKFCFLNLKDNACLVDNLSTTFGPQPLPSSRVLTIGIDYFEDSFKGNNGHGDDDSRLSQSASTSHKLDNLLVGGPSSPIQ